MTVGKTVSFVLGRISPDKDLKTIEKISVLEGVDEVYLIYGSYDFLAQVRVDTMPNLTNTLDSINKISNVHVLKTLIGKEGEPARPPSY